MTLTTAPVSIQAGMLTPAIVATARAGCVLPPMAKITTSVSLVSVLIKLTAALLPLPAEVVGLGRGAEGVKGLAGAGEA